MLTIEAYVLGSAAARPYLTRGTSALYVQSGGTRILIDCGEGTQVELDRQSLSAQKLDAICITHMHGDHLFGLPGLLTSLALNQRSKTLTIIGPKEIKPYLEDTFFYSGSELTFSLHFEALDFKKPVRDILKLRDLTIHSIPLRHRIPACGFVVEQSDKGFLLKPGVIDEYNIPYRKIAAIKKGEDFTNKKGVKFANKLLTEPALAPTPLAYLTDTSPLAQYPEGWTPPALLFHDATFSSEHQDLATKTGHSTALEAAAFAKTCGADQLMLTHVSERYNDRKVLLEEAKTAFAKTSLAQA